MSRSWRRKAAPEIPTNGIDNQQINRNNRSASQIKPDSTDPLKPNHVGTKLFGQLSEDIQENKINVNLAGPLPRDLHDNACYTVQSVCDHDYGASLKTPNLESASSESTEVCTNLFNVPFQMKKIPVSINLSVVCRRVIELFQRFDQHADYLGPSSAHETLQKLALYRYEMFWLPLAAAHKLYAGAPVDVHWVWLAHMLDPLAYRQDCQRMVGKLIEHKLVSNKKLKQMTDKARAMWQLHYPKEPFDFNTGRTGFGNLLETHDRNLWNWSKIASGDLLTIARCHQHFFYQVSLPHYMQADHLKEAEQRYKQFVHLKRIQHQYQQWHNHGKMDFAQFVTNQVREDDNSVQETSNSLAEPLLSCLPFDIELCWRAHLFHPRAYARDMSCLFGKLLHHPCQPYRSCMLSRLDDSLFAVQFSNGTKDRVCGFPRIDQLWTTCFPDQPLDKSGCLDRGISTRNRLERLSSVDIYRIATKYAQVSLNSVVAQLHPTPDKFSIKIQHIGQLHGDHDSTNGSRQVAKLNSPGCVWNAVDPGKPIARFTVISGVHDELTIQLIDKRGWFCPSNSLLGLATVSLQRAIENFRETAPVDYVLSSEFEEDTNRRQEKFDKTSSYNNLRRETCLQEKPDLMSTNSSEEDYRRSTQVSKIKLSFTITPPNRHAVRLRVQLGPAVVCKLPPPCPNSLGEQIWGICCCSPQNNQMNDAFGCQMKGQSRTDKCSYCENCRLKMPRTPPATNCAVDSGLADSRSLVLIHEIVNHLNEHVFTVRVLHNLVMGLSVVQVYADDRLLSVGCQIDQKQLPFLKVQPNKQPGSKSKLTLVTQNGTSDNGLSHIFAQRKSNLCQTLLSTIKKDVTEDVVCSNTDALPRNSFGMTYPTGLGLHPLREERAMIVKDADGDWCIVIGHWSGFQRLPAPEMAVSSTDCTPEKTYLNFSTTRGSGGHLSLRMHWLKVNERKVTCAQIPDSMNSCSIILSDATVNIRTGEINVSRHCQDMAQNICLAFCCSVLHVLCQPRIITQEGHVHENISTTAENGRSTNNLKSTESCMTKLSTLDDLESPSVITSSTSFESAVCQVDRTQTDRLLVNDTPEEKCARTLFADGWKTEWVIVANAPKGWTSEIMQLTNPGFKSKDHFDICCQNRADSQDLEKPVKVVGMVYLQSVRHDKSTGDNTIAPRVQVALFKPINEFVSCMQKIEAKQNERSSLSKFNGTPPRTRGLMDSLTYVMCLGVGHPVDTLIPSIQILRKLQRAQQFSRLSHLNTVESHQVDSFNCNSVKTKDETMKPYDEAHNSLPYALHRIKPEEHENNISGSSEHNSIETSRHIPPINTSSEMAKHQSNLEDSHATLTKPSRSAFNGWHLSDFYDYFLLELPDVCSGCVYGCQFCNGLGIL